MTRRMLLSYAAGYFDGEGCITLMKNRNGRSYLRIAIVSYDRDSLQVFADLFGKEVKEIRMTSSMASRKTGFRWDENGAYAQDVLKELIPFLRSEKKSKARQVLKLVWRKRLRNYDGGGKRHHFRFKAMGP